MSERGDIFTPGADHPGDRVMWEGKEYRVTEYSRRNGLAYLISESAEYSSPAGPVNMNHLTISWCPESHGGSGKPQP